MHNNLYRSTAYCHQERFKSTSAYVKRGQLSFQEIKLRKEILVEDVKKQKVGNKMKIF